MFVFSAWNDRTNSYKNANFDIVLDQSVTQAKVFDQAGIYGLVKHVIDVSIVIVLCISCFVAIGISRHRIRVRSNW